MEALFGLAVSLALSSVGCASHGYGNGSTKQTDAARSCENVSLCEMLSLADVNAALGGSFYDSLPGLISESGPDIYTDSCDYDGVTAPQLYVDRSCFLDARAASARFDAARIEIPPPSPPGARIEVTGVGDEAFFDDNSSGTDGSFKASLHVIKDNIVVDIGDSVLGGEDVQSGFIALAGVLLARSQ